MTKYLLRASRVKGNQHAVTVPVSPPYRLPLPEWEVVNLIWSIL